MPKLLVDGYDPAELRVPQSRPKAAEVGLWVVTVRSFPQDAGGLVDEFGLQHVKPPFVVRGSSAWLLSRYRNIHGQRPPHVLRRESPSSRTFALATDARTADVFARFARDEGYQVVSACMA